MLKTGEGSTLAVSLSKTDPAIGVMSIIIKETLQEFNVNVDIIDANAKKSQDDLELYEATIEGIESDYKTLYEMNKELNNNTNIIKKSIIKKILFLEDELLSVWK